ncbi:MAG: 50S ribosomal protein L24 [Candidatus Marinimicrobia bacterium]|jgi:large subunit ribosomal protein L24|nr:50S ribosomal protein L24 [Candidatus Neomarinimicrobiota bacterium]MBT3496672.1 50S ribosomal protein L24 [Candidatus Neomarinimicrobiota bacterium]MBT3692976.1 50S ribosomal protein L24 [Candidatus Neomarinimicrobiota bacterium]MBT3731955.1 50S ribosomal protein L24 [Candidatus Neomarinimicrobiota bacterium]MBT4144026.1 50S ribosomal protein L24 [Candidatus Neomarinimicrobiota bacterium]
MFVKKGMTVKVISGNHKGMEGKVLHVFPKKQRVLVEGINFIKKAMRPTQENPSGGVVEKEAPVHVSNVMIVHGGQASRIGYKKLDDGSKIRISKKTNEEIEA